MIDVSFSSALDEANDIIEAGAHFKAVTERGRAVKARFAFFCNETILKEGNVDGDSVLYRIFHSLLAEWCRQSSKGSYRRNSATVARDVAKNVLF